MSELPAITTAPAPGPNFIQIYTKLSTKAISLGFWGADLATQRLHDIDSSANDALTVTTPQSQITDVEFYGATTVLGFVPQTGHTRHTLAFLSPAFKVLPETKTTVPIACTGLAGANTPGAQANSYVYFLRYDAFSPLDSFMLALNLADETPYSTPVRAPLPPAPTSRSMTLKPKSSRTSPPRSRPP